MSWGPLIHGHAPKGLIKALGCGGGERHELRRADRARDAAGPEGGDAGAVDGARAVRQLRHRGRDERAAGGAGGDQARQDHQVRRLLPRARGRLPGAGRLRRDDARRADQPWRPGGRRRRHPPGALQRSRLGRAAVHGASRRDRRGVRRADRRQHGTGGAGRRIPPGAPCAVRSRTVAAGLRRGDLGIPGGAGRRAEGVRRQAGHDLPRQDHRRRPAGGRLRRARRRDGARRTVRARLPGRNALGQSAGDDRRAVVAR